MCKKGGPRCSGDTRRARDRARERLDEVERRAAELAAAEQTVAKRLRDQLTTANDRLERWQELYDSTPDGQAELARARDAATGKERAALADRLKRAQNLREEELAHARRVRAEEGENHDDAGRSEDRLHSGHALDGGPRGVPSRVGNRHHGPGDGGRAPGRLARRAHPHGDGDGRRITLGGHETRALRRLPPNPRATALAHRPGVSAPEVYELDPATAAPAFRSAMQELKDGNRFHASVYIYDEAEYRDKRLFVTDDGKAGFALAGDEIVSVFRHPSSAYPNAAPALMAAAVSEGGRRLDCFDTVLPAAYARAGFVPVARLRWNDEYAPDGWNYDTYRAFNGGRPDVVFMAYDSSALDRRYERGAGQYVDEYDDAAPLVNRFLVDHE